MVEQNADVAQIVDKVVNAARPDKDHAGDIRKSYDVFFDEFMKHAVNDPNNGMGTLDLLKEIRAGINAKDDKLLPELGLVFGEKVHAQSFGNDGYLLKTSEILPQCDLKDKACGDKSVNTWIFADSLKGDLMQQWQSLKTGAWLLGEGSVKESTLTGRIDQINRGLGDKH